ncbi:MAG: peptide chain release factor N(5)-glutamine methyltransferase [Beijerinckiaceae bacterium]|nr:peptide chain release factor N(5)-glutamine methyltransferase [Beijerinckiaceae bacterium]MCI0735067.1 peptide chain release factor N(5)-glutamine methyltransferase [Beijerinckiaceae bacterium]
MSGQVAIGDPPRFVPVIARGFAHHAIARCLAEAGIESPHADARLLLCSALGIDHADFLRDPAGPIGGCAATLESFVARRLRGEPVSRIIGERDFWQSRFKISPAVLDPRPSTEALIVAVVDHAARCPRENWRILDLGTGSGAILCSLLQSLPGSDGIGVDISLEACLVARENLARLGLARLGLVVCGDWMRGLRGPFDVIVSNPPYVARGEFASLPPEVRDHDPSLALDGGEDGLAAYREIIPASLDLLAPGGVIALEVAAGQRFAVEWLLRNAFGTPVEARLDLGGHWRVVMTNRAL